MKKTSGKLTTMLLVAAIILAGIFGFLWHRERNAHADLEQLCYHSAQAANKRFCDLHADGSTFSFDYGMAELVSFYNSYKLLCVETSGSTNTNCVYLNNLIGILMASPEEAGEVTDQLIAFTAMLSENIYDENAYDLAFSVYNQLSD